MYTRELKIKTRLMLGFGAIMVMVLFMGGMAMWHSWKIWENTDYLYNHPFKVNIAIREIETNVMAIQQSMKSLALAESQEQKTILIQNINNYESDVYRAFDTIYSQFLGRRSTVDTAISVFRDWKPSRDETIRMSLAAQQEDVRQRVKTIGEEHVSLIMKKMAVLQDFAMGRANAFYITALSGKNLLFFRLVLILVLILVSSGLIVIFILRGVTIPLSELVRFAQKYGRGEYQIRNEYVAGNELGVLGASMNKMAESVQFEMSVKNGIREIIDQMLAFDELSPFCKAVLNSLMSQTKSNLGAVYILNEETDLFEPYYSCGYTREKLRAFSSKSNEGELGLVIAGKTLTRITQFPDDTVFQFSTVAGTVQPREGMLIPIVRRKEVVAIVAIANIATYTPLALEIIRQCENNLNMSFNAIMAFERIRQYASSLDEQNEKLNTQAKELQVQTRELVEQNTELELQKQQIDEANRLKSQFLSSMSHELRTPLNSVIALSGVLGKRLKGNIPEEEHGYFEIIERNAKNLLSLINDILDLSRIEAGKIEVHAEMVSLEDLVKYILVSHQTQIANKQLTVTSLFGPEIPRIMTDSDKCHHILENLISNAVKFTEKGSIEISAQFSGLEVRVMVKDTGIGIPPEQLEYIFDEFRQVDGTTSRKYGGTGLGLAIVDKYARILEAKVEVESVPGKGSSFTIIFPVVPAFREVQGAIPRGMARKYPVELPLKHELLQPGDVARTILIVEDSEPAIIQLSGILADQGYNLQIANNGNEALEKVSIQLPDAIILDLMMPGMDGFDVLEKLRGTRESARIPILILTAMYLTPSDLKRLNENNIHQLVQKGDIKRDELLKIIRQMIFPANEPEPAGMMIKKSFSRIKGKAKILIIDENEDDCITLKVLLTDKHEVVVHAGRTGAAELAGNMKTDLIFLDIPLPGENEFEVFDQIRNQQELRHIPIIAVTARAMKGDREKILEYGFDDYLAKPIDIELFEEKTRRWFH